MRRRVEHGNVARARKWGLPIGWRASGTDAGHTLPEIVEPEPTEPPATPPPVDAAPQTRRVEGSVELRMAASADPSRPLLAFGKALDATVAPERIWPAPLPEEHLVMTPHCDGRHGPREEADERCVWCDVLTDLASDMRETRRRVTALEAAVDELRAENERRSEYEREMRERSS